MSKRQRRKSNQAAQLKRQHQLESLEPRTLLTTVFGGETFAYRDSWGQVIHVTVGGDAIIELIGAVSDINGVTVGDMAGSVISSDIGRDGVSFFGGIEGKGVEPIGLTPIVADAVDPNGVIPVSIAGTDAITLAALATRRSDNATYAFNVTTLSDDEGEESNVIQLVQIDPATGEGTAVAHLEGVLPVDDDNVTTVSAIQAAAFNPIDGLLYFVASAGSNEIDRLYTVDVDAGGAAAIAASVTAIDGNFGEAAAGEAREVTSIVFDQTGLATTDLWAFMNIEGEGGRLVEVNQTNTNLSNIFGGVDVRARGANVTNITGIEFVDDNAGAEEGFMYAVRGPGGASELLRIDMGSGLATTLGFLPDTLDAEEETAPQTGANIQGLTWSDTEVNPFTGTPGVLLGTDATSDELLYIDHRFRAPMADLFAIYITQASENASISISVNDTSPEPIGLLPYKGIQFNPEGDDTVLESDHDNFDLMVIRNDLEAEEPFVKFQKGTGGVYLGGRELAGREGYDELKPWIPITEAVLATASGTRAEGVDDLEDDDTNNLSAGLVVARTLVDYFNLDGDSLADRLVGANLDNIQGLSVARDGTIVAVDSDFLDRAGDVAGDQLALIGRDGKALDSVNITDGVDELDSIQGMDFADVTFSGNELLYAVFDVGGVATLGTLDFDSSSVNFGLFTPIGALGGGLTGIRAMSFSPNRGSIAGQRGLYVIGDDNVLYEINPLTGGLVATLGPVQDTDGNNVAVGSMDFAADGVLYLHDVENGRLLDLNRDTGEAGANVATEAGTLRPTIGAIAWDDTTEQMLAMDNAPSALSLGDDEAGAEESAVLMALVGLTSTSSVGQNIDKVLVGGKFSGRAWFSGSANLVYAGVFLNGQTSGQFSGDPEIEDNFFANGDIRNIVSASAIGTNFFDGLTLEYSTGFDLEIGGKVSQILSLDAFVGFANIENRGAVDGLPLLTSLQSEVESWEESDNPEGDAFEDFRLFRGEAVEGGEDAEAVGNAFSNDTLDTAQRLGSVRSNSPFEVDRIRITGQLDWVPGDNIDFYSISLMAGQSITVQMTSLDGDAERFMRLGIFDPTGRLIASDYSKVDQDTASQSAITITADRPGEYVIGTGDILSLTTVDAGTITLDSTPYLLEVVGGGDLALGGLVAGASILAENDVQPFLRVARGDLGSVVARQTATSLSGPAMFQTSDPTGSEGVVLLATTDILVGSGDFRVFRADHIEYPRIEVTQGSIGLIQVGAGTSPAVDGEEEESGGSLFVDEIRAGGDIQLINVEGDIDFSTFSAGGEGDVLFPTLIPGVVVDGGIGVIRAGGFFFGALQLNADHEGQDGVLDLVDVDILDGVQFDTGPGGNVRYIRANTIFQDWRFDITAPPIEIIPGEGTGSAGNTITLDPGQSFNVVDDGGGQVMLRPTGQVSNPEFEEDDGNGTGGNDVPEFLAASLEIQLYGIFGTGGAVIVEVKSDGGVSAQASSDGNGMPVEISKITAEGSGREIIRDPRTGRLRLATEDDETEGGGEEEGTLFQDLNVSITGQGTRVDVLEIEGGNFTSINNSTGGEIVTIHADSVANLQAGTLGLALSSTGSVVEPNVSLSPVVIDDEGGEAGGLESFPFLNQPIGIVVGGDLLNASALRGLGNFMVGGTIVRVIANSDRQDTVGEFEGIAGPILAQEDILFVDIGEGIAEGGTGEFARSGLFAEGELTLEELETESGSGNVTIREVVTGGIIGQVVGNGVGADIRGPIHARGKIGTIDLRGGSIVNTTILVSEEPEDVLPFTLGFLVVTDPDEGGEDGEIDFSELGRGNIEAVNLNGAGGILASFFGGNEIGDYTVRGGFGILGSYFWFTETLGDVYADGFGIRDVTIDGGDSVGDITAAANGAVIQTSDFSPSVRVSEVDPSIATRLNDLATYLGTTSDISGVIEGTEANALVSMGVASAYLIRGIEEELGEVTRTQFNFANSIGGIRTVTTVDDLRVRTGALGFFQPGADVAGLDLGVAGEIDKVVIKGNLIDGSRIATTGQNGNIGSILIEGDWDGELDASGRVGTVQIKGDLSGDFRIRGTNPGIEALKSLTLDGSLTNGSLDINGSVGSITTAGGLGQGGDRLVINGDLGTLKVGASSSALLDGATLGLEMVVMGDVNTFDVVGQVGGPVNVRGSVNSFKVTADAATAGTSIVDGNVSIARGAKSIAITGGDVTGDVVTGLDITSVSITNGDLLAGASIVSAYGNIGPVTIKGGDLLGEVRAPNGDIKSVTVTGSDLGPASLIEALNVGAVKIDGSMRTGARIVVEEVLASLTAGHDIEAGASIDAGSVASITTGNHLLADLDLGYNAKGTTLKVGGNLGGDSSIDTNTKITVGGDVVDGSTLAIGRNLDQLAVNGTILGSVIVDGSAASLSANALSGAIITTGFDLASLAVKTAVTNSLVQAGISRGNDGAFSADAADKDLGEVSRMANLGKFSAASVTDSVVAAGGSIDSVSVTGVTTNSSFSSGLSLGSEAIAAALADATLLADAAEQDAARGGDDRSLFHGDIGAAKFNGGLVNSDVTAGVDAGADGAFGTGDDATVIPNATGLPGGAGRSEIKNITGAGDAGSNILADTGIGGQGVVGANVNADVTHALAALTVNNPLETLIGTATQGTPLIYTTLSGKTVTVTVSGPGTVALHDEAGGDTDENVDTLVISGTTASTRISVTTSVPGSVTLGRVLAADDAQIGEFTFDGELVGDGTNDPDLWLEGDVKTFTLAELGDDARGVIGGDVASLEVTSQGAGLLKVNGTVTNLTIANGDGDPLLTGLGSYAGSAFNTVAVNSAGAVFVHENGTLSVVDPTVDNGVISSTPVLDNFSGDSTSLIGMDFSAADTLYGVASVQNFSPITKVGQLINDSTGLRLTGMAVNAAGEVFAIQNVDTNGDTLIDYDQLVKFNTTTGLMTVVGKLRGLTGDQYANNVLAIGFSDNKLFALINDLDGLGHDFGVDAADSDSNVGFGVALVQLESTDSNADGFVRVGDPGSSILLSAGKLLNGGGMTNTFTALSVSAGGTIYAVRRDLGDTQDELVTIDTDGTVTPVGGGAVLLDTNGDGGGDTTTRIVGIGFDADGNLVALNRNGAATELIGLKQADLNDPTRFVRIGAEGVLSGDLDAFAIGRGSDFSTWAYDFDDIAGGALYTDPGSVLTLGTVDTSGGPANGRFTQLQPLAEDALGTGLTADVLSVSVDPVSGDVFVVTDDNRLIRYDGADGSFVSSGDLTDAQTGEPVAVAAIEFDAASGKLLGLDNALNRIVEIDTATAVVSGRTEAGAVFTDLASLSNNPVSVQYLAFNGETDRFVAFRGSAETDLTGIVANSFSKVEITGPGAYAARVAATGNSFGSVDVQGDFNGALATPGTIDGFKSTGAFGGALSAGTGIKKGAITGAVSTDGVVRTFGGLDSLTQGGGAFGGLLEAAFGKKVTIGGQALPGSSLRFTSEVNTLTLNNSLAGDLSAARVTGKLTLKGSVDGTGRLDINGDAKSLAIAGGTAANAVVNVTGTLWGLNVGGTHSGTIASRLGMGKAAMNAADGGLLVAGIDTAGLTLKGDAVRSAFVFGVFLGADGLLNTDDDLISGGSILNASFSGDFSDSVLAAGVLPNLASGQYVASSGNGGAFSGSLSNPLDVVDDAGAGGDFASRIDKLAIKGSVVSSPGSGRKSVAAAADTIGKVDVGSFLGALTQRTYGDPFGGPQVVRTQKFTPRELRVVFSEAISSDSFVLSTDIDGDGDVTGLGDTPGTVMLTDTEGNVLGGITLKYMTQTDADGIVQGVLRIVSDTDFATDVSLTLFGEDGRAIHDRSGLRSALRDFNIDGFIGTGEDPFGTVLDGDGDGFEGGNFTTQFNIGDASDEFVDAIDSNEVTLPVDGGPVTIVEQLDDDDDADIFYFSASQFEFFSAHYEGDAFASFALFFQDDQGTAGDTDDDTFELVSRWETNHPVSSDGDELFGAWELPETGNYFLVVTTAFGDLDNSVDSTYTLEMRRSSTDDLLDGTTDGAIALPDGELVGYVSNTIGEHNNLLGANTPKQLVYLNFTGGESQIVSEGTEVEAFDLADVSIALDGLESQIINGGAGVTGIVQNILTIYSTVADSYAPGAINVVDVTGNLAAYDAATSGLYFTTEDPALSGMDPSEFKTVLIGDAPASFGLFGLAGSIGFANMDKGGEAIVYAPTFSLLPFAGTEANQLNELSRAFANVIAHELAHVLGFNHTDAFGVADDPDNNPATDDDSFTGVNLISAGPNLTLFDWIDTRWELGTSGVQPLEFARGWQDMTDQLTRWFA